VSDLLQDADYPVPPGWEEAMGYALDALERLPRSKVSVAAGRVAIDATAETPDEQARLQTWLARERPEGVSLALDVTAPRPVVTPYTLRVRLQDGRLRFDACVADTEAGLRAILAAATAAGAEGPVECRLALGSPSPEWGDAVAAGLAALAELGGGTLAVSDADVALVATPGTDAALFDRVAGELGGRLPEAFTLAAERPAPPAAAGSAPEGPPEFRATLADGRARLQGRLPDPRVATVAEALAQARFGAEGVTVATRVAPEGLPPGWSLRVLAGLGALAHLGEGEVRVTPDLIAVRGRTGNPNAREAIAAGVLAALGPEAEVEIEVAYDEALDPASGLPTPEECLAQVTAATEAAKITFDPGSDTLSDAAEPVIERIAEILKPCGEIRLRIAGYTDSQGRESSNLQLSQARAEAVLAALRAERVPVMGFEARGFGEAQPIADNGTEAGREANRRIEFSLVGGPAPSAAAAPAAALPAAMQGPPPPPALAETAPETAPGAAPGAAQGGEASAGEAVLPAAQVAVVPDVHEGSPPVEPPSRPTADEPAADVDAGRSDG
jgi:OOP family OmpA-OmpF porin